MVIDRRKFLTASAAVASAGVLSTDSLGSPDTEFESSEDSQGVKSEASVRSDHVPNRIAVSTYSFWRYNVKTKLSIEKCIDHAARMGFDGVEILHVQMEDESHATMQKYKQQAFVNGLDLCGFSTHQSFVSPSKEIRQKNIDKTIKCMEMAYAMGIPTIRVNTGRWGTTKSFDKLMENKGLEPRLEGYSDEDGFKWVIDSLEKCVKTAEKTGVTMGLENHWGIGRNADAVIRIVNKVNSPWLKVTLDTGNFLEDMFQQQKMMAPHTVFVQAKTYYGGGKWYSLETDYPRTAKILQDAGYKGYVSLEFEGKEAFETAIPKSLKVLRDAFSVRQK